MATDWTSGYRFLSGAMMRYFFRHND